MVDEPCDSPVGCHQPLHLGILAHAGEDSRRVGSVAQSVGWTSETIDSIRLSRDAEVEMDLMVICVLYITADVLATVTEASLDPRIPVLVVGRDRDPQHLADVLRSGAADYLVAPFAAEELVVRAQALVKRSQHVTERRSQRRIVFDFFTRTVVVGPMQMSLSQREWDALIVLLEAESEPVTVETLSERLTGAPDNETIVISTISRLRKKRRFNHFYAVSLETVYGHGYLARFRRASDTYAGAHKII